MKRTLSIFVIVAMLLTISITTAFASTYGDPTGYGYTEQDWYYDYNGNNSSYSGEVYGDRYNENQYGQTYYWSDWTSTLQDNYNYPEAHESVQREVKRGEAFFLALRTIQDTLGDRGYARLQAGYEKPPFWDMDQLVPNAQSEVNILWSKGILIGYEDGSMRMGDVVTREEFAAIFNRVNRLFLNMPSQYGTMNFYDVEGRWSQEDVQEAVSCGVLKGVGNNTFEPEMPLTIEQIWAISDRYVGQNGIRRENVADAMMLTFDVEFEEPYNEDYSDDWDNDGQKIYSLSMRQSSVKMEKGDTTRISAKINPSSKSNVKIDWRSSNTSVVSIEHVGYENGIAYADVKARKTGSSVTITARTLDGSNKTGTTRVTVSGTNYSDGEEVTRLEAVDSSITISQGSTKDVSVRIYPSDADNKELDWESSNSDIAYIEKDWNSGNYGYARIRGENDGNTTLRVQTTDGGNVTIKIYVKVTDTYENDEILAERISIGTQDVYVEKDNSVRLSATVYPTNTTDKTLSWESDDIGVATVNSSGVVYGKDVGNCTITVRTTDGSDIEEHYNVTVKSSGNNNTDDNVVPVVELLGAGSVKIGKTITLTARASDNEGISNFVITAQDIQGLTAGLVVRDVQKTSATQYSIVLYAVEVSQQGLGIAPGAATDAAGNSSDWSSECVVTVTAN